MNKLNILMIVMLISMIGLVFAIPFTPQGDIDMKWTYDIINVPNLNITNIYANYTYSEFINATGINVNGTITADEFQGNLNWTYLQNYPDSCPAGYAVTQINDTLTCSDYWVDVTGDTMTGDLVIQAHLNVTENVTTNNWFRGLFNWSIFPDVSRFYLTFTGSDLIFNESKLNDTINTTVNLHEHWVNESGDTMTGDLFFNFSGINDIEIVNNVETMYSGINTTGINIKSSGNDLANFGKIGGTNAVSLLINAEYNTYNSGIGLFNGTSQVLVNWLSYYGLDLYNPITGVIAIRLDATDGHINATGNIYDNNNRVCTAINGECENLTTNASNILNEYWVNESGDTMTGNLIINAELYVEDNILISDKKETNYRDVYFPVSGFINYFNNTDNQSVVIGTADLSAISPNSQLPFIKLIKQDGGMTPFFYITDTDTKTNIIEISDDIIMGDLGQYGNNLIPSTGGSIVVIGETNGTHGFADFQYEPIRGLTLGNQLSENTSNFNMVGGSVSGGNLRIATNNNYAVVDISQENNLISIGDNSYEIPLNYYSKTEGVILDVQPSNKTFYVKQNTTLGLSDYLSPHIRFKQDNYDDISFNNIERFVVRSKENNGAVLNMLFYDSNNVSEGNKVIFHKSEGNEKANDTLNIGSMEWKAYNGSEYISSAKMDVKVSGTIDGDTVPTDIIYSVREKDGNMDTLLTLANEYSVAVGNYQNSIRPEHTLELFNYGDSSNKFVVRRNDGGYTDSGYLMIDNPARNQARIQFPTNSTAGGPYGNGMLLIGGGYGNLSSPTFVEFMRINAVDVVPANVQPQFGFNTRNNPSEFFHLKASNQPANIRLEVDSSNQFTSGLRFFESTTDRGGVLFNSSNDDIVISSYQGSTYGVIPSLTFNGDEIIIGDRSIGSVGYKLIFDANMTQSSPIIVFRNNLVEEGYIQYFMDSRMLIKMNNENHSIDLESDNININGKITNISGNLSVSVDGYINESRICTVANPCLDNVTNITNDLYWRLDSSNSPSTNNWTHEGNFNVDDGEFTAYKNSGTNRINVTSGLNSVTLGTTYNTFAGLYFHNSAGLMLGRESLGDLFINEYGGVGLGNYIIPNDIDLFIYKNTPTIMMYDIVTGGNVSIHLDNQTLKFINGTNGNMMTINRSGDITVNSVVLSNGASITDNSTCLILKSPDGSSESAICNQ